MKRGPPEGCGTLHSGSFWFPLGVLEAPRGFVLPLGSRASPKCFRRDARPSRAVVFGFYQKDSALATRGEKRPLKALDFSGDILWG